MTVTVIQAKKKRAMSWGERQSREGLLLNMWEWASRFGEGFPITFDLWKSYVYRPDVKLYREGLGDQQSAAGQAWLRFRKKAKRSPFPVEFVKVEDDKVKQDSKSTGATQKVTAVVFPPGTIKECQKILDQIDFNKELDAYYDEASRAAAADRHLPTWVLAAVKLGIHKEVACRECGEAEGLSCQVTRSGHNRPSTTLHLSRVYAAMEARDHNDED